LGNPDPGHPGPGGKQTGTKDTAPNELAYLQDLSAAVSRLVARARPTATPRRISSFRITRAGRNYGPFLGMNIERYYRLLESRNLTAGRGPIACGRSLTHRRRAN